MVPAGIPDEEIEKLALADAKIVEFVGQKQIRKVIVARGRLINIVIG